MSFFKSAKPIYEINRGKPCGAASTYLSSYLIVGHSQGLHRNPLKISSGLSTSKLNSVILKTYLTRLESTHEVMNAESFALPNSARARSLASAPTNSSHFKGSLWLLRTWQSTVSKENISALIVRNIAMSLLHEFSYNLRVRCIFNNINEILSKRYFEPWTQIGAHCLTTYIKKWFT